jgi:hypothetical protein
MRGNKTNLMEASRQWSVRPADQRFWTLQELYERTKRYAEESEVEDMPLALCGVVPAGVDGNDLKLVTPSGDAEFQHYSFGQFAALCEAPAAYLRGLPAPLAADCLNHGMESQKERIQSMMFHRNGGLHLRAVTSNKYARIWNWEVAELALALQEQDGWVTPPARPTYQKGVPVRKATQADVLRKSAHPSMGVEVGDDISPAGLYASHHDCFIFQVNENYSIDAGGGENMYRGVFWRNSEVGECKWSGTFFLYDSICGNHIVWGARVLAEMAIRHVGNAREQYAELMAMCGQYLERSAREDEQRIAAAKVKLLGDGRSNVVEFVAKKQLGLSLKDCDAAYTIAERFADEHNCLPNSAWGFVSGLTRLSQGQWADARDRMDRAAGKILELAAL